uniref:Serine-threonine/tyrosine-protein kinase catalytic domain-containing protein n=1 Tax=Oryza glumipatula TaxID=40148 RepID=A0A0D9Y8T9_9ORYZ
MAGGHPTRIPARSSPRWAVGMKELPTELLEKHESFGVVLLEMLTGRRSMDKKRPAGFGSLEQDALQGHREWVQRP